MAASEGAPKRGTRAGAGRPADRAGGVIERLAGDMARLAAEIEATRTELARLRRDLGERLDVLAQHLASDASGTRRPAQHQLHLALAFIEVVIEIDHQYDAQHSLGRFSISLTGEDAPLLRPEHPPQWRELLAAAPGTLEEADEAELHRYFYSLDKEYRELERAQQLVANPRLAAVQDLAWALINSPAFLFNH